MSDFRVEKDLLGEKALPKPCLWGIHTQRGLENFPITEMKVSKTLIHAYAMVKLACLQTNRRLGIWEKQPVKYSAMEQACNETIEGMHDAYFKLDALQGGAGTSTNMNLNEVLANRALQIMGKEPGEYQYISPIADLNLHQSTNDTYPTSLKVAAILGLRRLESSLVALQEAFQEGEKKFAHHVKVGRTQYQDAVLTTLGREMGAWAEAINRDRWRIYKCEERLRVVNLGGTAIGTGITAPRQYIFGVTEKLNKITGLGLARAENLFEATQNNDAFIEVSGMLKTCASNLFKITNDIRFMSSGPSAGIGEIEIPAVQAGSSIMPGKVNPVVPECVAQVAMYVMGMDSTLTTAVSMGSMELNSFLPLVAHCLLSSIQSLTNACDQFQKKCISGIEARSEKLASSIRSSSSLLTAMVSDLGYERVTQIARKANEAGLSPYEYLIEADSMSAEQLDAYLKPEHVCRLGHPWKGESHA